MEDEHIVPPATVSDLTPRQLAVCAQLANGRTTKGIANVLGISERRVRVHITAIAYLCRLDPSGDVRVQIALWYRTHAAPIPGVSALPSEPLLERRRSARA